MNLLTNSLTAAKKTAAAPTHSESAAAAEVEGAKLGAAADRKRQEEAGDSLAAALESHAASGKGITWHRRIRANGEVRHVAMVERDGAYSERSFLNLCQKAARAAGKGRLRWDGEAVDSIAAELCLSILSETAGRMPRRGTLGRREGFESADAAYLTTCAGRIIAQALNGEKRRAGLSAEIDAMAAADGAALVTGDDLLAESVSAAESEPDRYLAEVEPVAVDGLPQWDAAEWERVEAIARTAENPLTPNARQAVRSVAALVGERPAAVEAALVAALRQTGMNCGGIAQAAELAAAGYAASPGSFRKAASTGRGILRKLWDYVPQDAAQGEQIAALADALMRLCDMDTAPREGRHMVEQNGPAPYRGTSMTWPDRKVSADGEQWATPADLSSYPPAALAHG